MHDQGTNPLFTVAQLGARMHYAVPAVLQQVGLLEHFFTDCYVGPGSAWQVLVRMAKLLSPTHQPTTLRKLLSRQEPILPPEKITAFNLFGLHYAMRLRLAKTLHDQERIFLDFGNKFCQLILKNGCGHFQGVYALQSAALPLFWRAKETSSPRILENFSAPQLIQHQIFSAEHQAWPHWDKPYPDLDVWSLRIALEQEEWRQADRIICPSEFVARSLASLGVEHEKICVVPYGINLVKFGAYRPVWDGRRPLRLLFMGSVTIRKGIQYLHQALQLLNSERFETRVVGALSITQEKQALLRQCLELTGQVARPDVIKYYRWADVFVFPSVCEGSATVTYEALAAGLPVITTSHAGSVVRDGVDGFIVPIRDGEALADRLERLARDPRLLAKMSVQARHRAQEFSWERYGPRLVEAITSGYNKQTIVT